MNFSDRLITGLDNALRTLAAPAQASRSNPGAGVESAELSGDDKKLAGALMRVNHVGEVCAQALYEAQALSADSEPLRRSLRAAAREETDHLAWTEERLRELGARPSLLNPLWYAGAFGMGLLAGRLGPATSLGFVVETEHQVEAHLAGHLDRLPAHDARSRAIVQAMQADERRHADAALDGGGVALPLPARLLMKAVAKIMTTTAHRI